MPALLDTQCCGDVFVLNRRQAGGVAAGHVGDRQLDRDDSSIGFGNRQPHCDCPIGIDRERLLQDIEVKILHRPISFLKENRSDEPRTEQLRAADLVNRMFGLQDEQDQ